MSHITRIDNLNKLYLKPMKTQSLLYKFKHFKLYSQQFQY